MLGTYNIINTVSGKQLFKHKLSERYSFCTFFYAEFTMHGMGILCCFKNADCDLTL